MRTRIILILLVITGIGWYSWSHFQVKKITTRNLTTIDNYYLCSKEPGSIIPNSTPNVCITQLGQRFVKNDYSFYLRYSDPDNKYSFLYPDDWHLINEKHWDDNGAGTFNHFIQFGPDFQTYSTFMLRTFNNIENDEINILAKRFLFPIFADATIKIADGTILGNQAIFALQRDDSSLKPLTLITLFWCDNYVYLIEYHGMSDEWHSTEYVKDIMLSFQCNSSNNLTEIPDLDQLIQPHLLPNQSL